ncbi:MAG: anti-phage ZorAB system protein ZorA [Deferrisomatales bacterium]|nr:anti-phage ZorAB system protein ZorA [Deferrisomatales bacterium]
MDPFAFCRPAAEAVTSIGGISVIIVAIVIWAFLAWLRFGSRLRPIERQLQAACQVLQKYAGEESFAVHLHDFDEEVKTLEIIQHPWHEFYETLIPGPDENPPVIFNTQSAAAFFTREAFLGNRINIRFYNALPNLLTGAGILGTFVGLVAGIYLASGGLASPNVEDAKAALQSLLHGASLAFWTSIAGLVTSIIFSWGEKHALHRLERFRHQWIAGLDARLQRITPEKIARDTQSDVRQQTASLQQFTTELAFQIAQAFEEKVSAPMGPVMERLITAVEGLRQDQGQSNDEMLLQVVQRFSDSISGAAGQEMNAFGATVRELTEKLERQISAITEQNERAEQASRESLRVLGSVFQEGGDNLRTQVSSSVSEITTKLGAVVTEMSEQLRTTSATIGDRNQQMEQATRDSLQAMGETFRHGGEQFQGQVSASVNEITAGLRDAAQDISQRLRVASADSAESMSRISSMFERTVSEMASSLDSIRQVTTETRGVMQSVGILSGALRETNTEIATIGNGIRGLSEGLALATEGASTAAQHIDGTVDKLFDAVARLDANQKQVREVWVDYKNRFEAIDASLAGAFSEIEAGLSRYTSTVKTFMEGMDGHTSQITKDFSGAVGDFSQAVEDLNDTMARRQ